jgi:TonB family protein
MDSPRALVCTMLLVAVGVASCGQRGNPPRPDGDSKALGRALSDMGLKPLGPYLEPDRRGVEAVDSGHVYFDFQVEKQAVALPGNDPPHYPVVHFLGMAGSVSAQFVIDTSGRVTPRSIGLLGSSDTQLIQPVLDAVRTMRFRPAEIRGRRVAERIEITFTFPPTP